MDQCSTNGMGHVGLPRHWTDCAAKLHWCRHANETLSDCSNVARPNAGLDEVLIKKKSKLELAKEEAALAPRQAAVKRQSLKVRTWLAVQQCTVASCIADSI